MKKERKNRTDAKDIRENGNGVSWKLAKLPFEARGRKKKY